MRLIAQFARRRGLDHVIAIGICALMLLFAVCSKVAAYHPKELAARSIAATKVWQAKNTVADTETVAPRIALQTAVELILLLTLCIVAADLPFDREHSERHSSIENFASLAMRPPPAF